MFSNESFIQDVDETLVDLKTYRFSTQLDLDNDNLLNRREFQLWYNPSLEQKVKEEISFLFSTCDDNGDLLICKQELLNHCDVLIKNQLTNFGLVFYKNTPTDLKSNKEL